MMGAYGVYNSASNSSSGSLSGGLAGVGGTSPGSPEPPRNVIDEMARAIISSRCSASLN